MYSKILGAFLAVSLLAACSSSDSETSGRGSGGSGLASSGSASGAFGSIADKVFFDADQSVIRPDAAATLDAQAEWLNRNQSVNVTIAGDCDERGTEEYNLALGNRRAYAAATYLSVKGVAPTRIETVSFGKDKPLVPGSSEEAWAQNRNAITSVR